MEARYEKLLQNVEKNKSLVLDAVDYLWKNPETGYKEWKSHKYLKEAFEKLGYEIHEAGNIPGFYTDLDTGRPGPTMLIMAELDALCIPTHPDADPETGAVHACGHHAQSAGLLGAAAALKEPGALDGLCGKIRFMEVPAEEAIEIEFREELRKQGIIRYFGGKQEFIARGYADGCDLNTLIHTSGRPAYHFDTNPGADGFVIKTFQFQGKSVHAASPHNGHNALYAATNALNAINALRETFRDSDVVRVHPIITKGGSVVNAIPDDVTMESYVRAATVASVFEENAKVNRAAAGAALSMGANLVISERPGYLPQNNDPYLCKCAMDAANMIFGEGHGENLTKWGGGSSDMGDMTAILPTAYIHVGGIQGKGHTTDFHIDDPEAVCVSSSKLLVVFAAMMLENDGALALKAKEQFKPVFANKEEYCAAMDKMIRDDVAISYGEDGTATVKW